MHRSTYWFRATRATQGTKTRSIAALEALDHAMLAVKTQKSPAKKWLRFFAGIRDPSPPFDGESVDIEPMNVPHCSRMARLWMKYMRQ